MPNRSHRWCELLRVACAILLLEAPAAAGPAQPGEPPEGLSAEAWEAISAAVEGDRYGARRAADAGALEASNPAQRYAARFTASGVTVSLGGSPVELVLTLTGVGFGDALRPVAPAVPRVDGQRVEYLRGDLIEWYVNRPSGLEQGWTLTSPPGEAAGDEPLRLALAVSGGLNPVLAADGSAVELRDDAGETRLRYAGLAAWDAAGRQLPVELEASAGRIVIAVEAAGAVYPLTVDPTFVRGRAMVRQNR